MNNFYYCIDIGGTFIKAGIVDNNNNIILSTSTPTDEIKKKEDLATALFEIIQNLSLSSNLNYKDAAGIGIGITGLVDIKNGIVSYTIVTKEKNYPLKSKLEKLTNIPVKIGNDADVATLAEQFDGAGIGYKNFVMLTIGTGIGCGIVLDGHNLGIKYERPVEIGHTRISDKQTDCTCGEIGCYERLGSTSALVFQVKNALKSQPKHIIFEKYTLDEINGKIIFDYIDDDLIKSIINQFIEYISLGIINLVNIFKPEIIIIGGAISKQKENLIKPIEQYVNTHSFLKHIGYKSKIVPAKFTGDAGIIGAKYLFN